MLVRRSAHGEIVRPVDEHIKNDLTGRLVKIGEGLAADVVAIVSPIVPGLEHRLRQAIESLSAREESIAVILDTPGGVVEVVERMVTVLRAAYPEVTVLVPDRAMSAGTIFALSADRIMMDNLSCLGPIDPQIEKDGKLVPALSYLNQFERLNAKASSGGLTTAEYALLNKLDLGELYQFEQARDLSIDLLIKWLSSYKFKNWNETDTQKTPVTEEMKIERAGEIAQLLNDPEKWRSHGRAIDIGTLRDEVKLQIDNLADNDDFYKEVRVYFGLLQDYMQREQLVSDFGTPFDLGCREVGLQRNRRGGRSVGESRCILRLALVRTAAQRQFAGQWLVGGQATTGKTGHPKSEDIAADQVPCSKRREPLTFCPYECCDANTHITASPDVPKSETVPRHRSSKA